MKLNSRVVPSWIAAAGVLLSTLSVAHYATGRTSHAQTLSWPRASAKRRNAEQANVASRPAQGAIRAIFPETLEPTVTPAPGSMPEVSPRTPGRTSGSLRQQEIFQKTLKGMGGIEAIDQLKTLEIAGLTTQFGAAVRPVDARVKTWIVFPDRYRRDLEFSFGRVSTILGPEGFFLQSGDSTLPLPENERREIAAAILRHPVVLLRERIDTGLVVLDAGREERDGHQQETLDVVSGGELSKLEIDPRTGWIVAVRYLTAARTSERQETEIRYSDFRKVRGVFFPFVAEGRIGGNPAFSNRIESVTVNARINPTLFVPPAPAPTRTPRSAAKRRSPRLQP